MTIYTVTGLGYGDEGKGTTVDFLARQGSALVVRHNGGPQAGHNVVLANGKHHEFSQFGSGTFAGADTFLSRFMLVNPLDMLLEADHLNSLGVNDLWQRLHIDMEARIITPYHVALQRLQAYARGESCGKGIGEAMRQDLARPDLTIRVKDLMFTNLAMASLAHKLEDLRRYLAVQAPSGPDFDVLTNPDLADQLVKRYHDWRAMGWFVVDEREVMGVTLRVKDYEHIIFEGAQGVLLDEWDGFHPYTTWSTTTDANALALLKEAGWGGPVQRLGVTRAYATRHGAGPFVTQADDLDHHEPYNVTGLFQGEFRRGDLDLVALRYAVEICHNIDGLVVTHLDRARGYARYWRYVDRYAYQNLVEIDRIRLPIDRDLDKRQELTKTLMQCTPLTRKAVSTEELLEVLGQIAPIAIESHGPTADDKTWVNQVVPA